jgi:hypothetical protein
MFLSCSPFNVSPFALNVSAMTRLFALECEPTLTDVFEHCVRCSCAATGTGGEGTLGDIGLGSALGDTSGLAVRGW